MKGKRFRSIIHEIILLPLVIMVTITIITIISSIISYQNMEQKLIEGNLNSLQIAINQTDNMISQIDTDFIRYVTDNKSYTFMSKYDKNTPKSKYFRYEAQTTEWLSNLSASYGGIKGVFAYYENLDLLLFRGNNSGVNIRIHEYISKHLRKQEDFRYNHLQIVKISNSYYLLYTKKYGNFSGGCWIPLNSIMKNLGLDNENLLGTVYFMDATYSNTITEELLNSCLASKESKKKSLTVAGQKYRNYYVNSREEDFYLGILIPAKSMLYNIPVINKVIFIVVILSVFTIPLLLYWLQLKIVRPLKQLTLAMNRIGNGDRKYRIALENITDNNEFSRLMERFNQMMDELNELENNLYKTKIREQKAKLKYISQQIRPHFILNALNLLYTYEINEFELVKKMVLYLTKYFRYIVNLQVDYVILENDFQHVKTYLQIQKERYLDRLDYVVEWEKQVSGILIPPLIVQTFVENCIKYGFKNEEKMYIFVLACEREGKLKVTIADTGNGFPEESLVSINRFIKTRTYQDNLGIGIQNAIERMDILYQEKVQIEISNAPTGGAVVDIFLPLNL